MKTQARSIVFVCTGNVCRSPMAEYLLKHHLAGAVGQWTIRSAGTFADNGLPASPPAVDALREKGVDLSGHRSRALTQAVVDEATLIVVMTASHAAEVGARYPEARERILCLKAIGGRDGDVADPIGASVEVYRKTRDEIDEALLDLILLMKSYGAMPRRGQAR